MLQMKMSLPLVLFVLLGLFLISRLSMFTSLFVLFSLHRDIFFVLVHLPKFLLSKFL